MGALVHRARELQSAGRASEAKALYLEVLAVQPGHFEALARFASACLQTGDLAESVRAGREAVALRPGSGAARYHLGLALAGLGRTQEALEQYDESVVHDPAFAPAHFHRGVALHALGRPAEAVESFDRAISLKPDWAAPRSGRGVALRSLGRAAEALESYDVALRLAPGDPETLGNRGNALMDLGRVDEAVEDFRTALAAQPGSARAHNNLGFGLLADRPGEALPFFDRAVALDPAYATAHYNRGVALMGLRRNEDALAAYDAAIRLRHNYPEAHSNRAIVLLELERHQESIEGFDTAIRLAPDAPSYAASVLIGLLKVGRIDEAVARAEDYRARFPESADIRIHEALGRLARGEFARGWAEYEARWGSENFIKGSGGQATAALRRRFAAAPRPSDLAGRRLLLVGEQGVGDMIMFASMLPDVAALAASIAVVSEARLHRLFASSFPQVEVLDVETATRRLDEFEVVLPIGSLGRLFRNTPADFPGRPYLSPSEAARAAWAERLGPRQGRMRIGLSWRGGAAATGRTRRSVELPQLAAALRAPDRELVSLQYGEVAEEVAAAAAASGASIRCFAKSEIDDFDDLAALVLNLDAVVSVQTALVHVCGAVGARCLAMVPFAPEWRYGQSGESMPWYGSVKILRQAEAGVWEPVLEKVGAELRRL